MTEQTTENAILDEVAVLKAKFETIRSETQDFLTTAKHLSDTGVHGAKELIESAKENWQNILSSFGGTGITSLFAKGKKPSKKKTPSKAKKAGKKPVKKMAKKAKKRK